MVSAYVHKRKCAANMPCLGFAEQLGTELLKLLQRDLDLRALAMKLAVGCVDSMPFSDELINAGRELLFTALEFAGSKLPVRERQANLSSWQPLKNFCAYRGAPTAGPTTRHAVPLPEVCA